MVKIVPISDTHQQHDRLVLPPGDILVVAGDVCNSGTKAQLRRFANWLWWIAPNYKHVVYVAGNHDKCARDLGKDGTKKVFEGIPNFHYLQDDWVVLEGLVFYGSPWTPAFFNWAFMTHSEEDRRKVWGMIPDKVDVLVTHGPPWGILDANLRGVMCGDPILLERVYQVKPQVHIFGHIHPGGGKTWLENGTIFYNAATVDEMHRPINPISVLEVEP